LIDGACGVPIACLKNDNTITNLVNEVVMIKIAGAIVRIVSKKTICNVVATCWGELAVSTEMLMPGIGVCA